MNDFSSYPPIEPTRFDLIVVGTGLPESVISAAASAVGKTVLHLDPNPFYGSHFASLSLEEFNYFFNYNLTYPPSVSEDHDVASIDLTTRSLYSDVEISSNTLGDDKMLQENSRKFILDLAGPRALFCADKSVDLLLKSGASQYLEFKSIDANFIFDGNGDLTSVPDSRAAIFKDKSLKLTEKNKMMKFFKLIQQHLAHSSDGSGDESDGILKISEDDLESPFISFLDKMGLPPKIKSTILYAIALEDYDQENGDFCKFALKTKDGVDRLALYSASIGRFSNAPGALIYPVYGQGELPQSFCRRAAVKGCIYVLRMPVISLLMDERSGDYKGVRLASGQNLYGQQLLLDPSFRVLLSSSSIDPLKGNVQTSSRGDFDGMVARAICITNNSLKQDVSSCLVVYPPRSLHSEQVKSIRALQIGGNLAVCPPGTFVVYFSTLCSNANEGKKWLRAAMNSLFAFPVPEDPESVPASENEIEKAKPTLVWSATYIQALIMSHPGSISSCPSPDGNLTYNNVLDTTMKLFHVMYPGEEYFPEMTSPKNPNEDEVGLDHEN